MGSGGTTLFDELAFQMFLFYAFARKEEEEFYMLQVITGSHDKTVKLWDLRKGKTMTTLTYHKKSVRGLALHPTEYCFASASAENIKKFRLPRVSSCPYKLYCMEALLVLGSRITATDPASCVNISLHPLVTGYVSEHLQRHCQTLLSMLHAGVVSLVALWVAAHLL